MKSLLPFLSRTAAAVSAALTLALTSCDDGDKPPPDPPAEASASAPAPAPPPAPTVILPASGDITTSAGTPSSPATRVLSPQEQNRVINVMMNRLAERQAQGLGSGTVKVNGAWNYDGYSYLSPNPASAIAARMVAVDVTVEGHTAGFDPDDIEIVDGVTQVSYGSDPHATFLSGPGEVIEDPSKYPPAPAATRLLLIYAFPRDSAKFTLFYWGKKLLDEPMEFEASGWGLPYPEKEKDSPAK